MVQSGHDAEQAFTAASLASIRDSKRDTARENGGMHNSASTILVQEVPLCGSSTDLTSSTCPAPCPGVPFLGAKEGDAVSTASDLPSLCFADSYAVTGYSQPDLQPMISTPAQNAYAQLSLTQPQYCSADSRTQHVNAAASASSQEGAQDAAVPGSNACTCCSYIRNNRDYLQKDMSHHMQQIHTECERCCVYPLSSAW